jgi:hypothetical protein
MDRSAKAWLVPTALALALSGGVAACGSEAGDYRPAPTLKRPAPRAEARFAGSHYVLTSAARPPIKRVTVGGSRLDGGRGWLVVVRVRLQSRLDTPLRLGLFSATLRARGGRSYEPILADGRETTKPAFLRPVVPASGAVEADLVYRLPRGAIAGSALAVSDPARRRSFRLRLF